VRVCVVVGGVDKLFKSYNMQVDESYLTCTVLSKIFKLKDKVFLKCCDYSESKRLKSIFRRFKKNTHRICEVVWQVAQVCGGAQCRCQEMGRHVDGEKI